jgi:hypothetical protein
MLVIRKVQMDTLDAYTREAFRRRMLQHVVAEFPGRAAELRPDGVKRIVDASIAKGVDYGVAGEEELQGFIDLSVELGPDFEEQPEMEWARQILEKESLSGQAKIELIHKLRGSSM